MIADKEEAKKTKEIQDKISEMKKVREVSKKVMAKKGLGDSSSDEDGGLDHAAKWVQRSRKKQVDVAARQAKRMQEEEEQAEQQAEEAAYYNSNSLAGKNIIIHSYNIYMASQFLSLSLPHTHTHIFALFVSRLLSFTFTLSLSLSIYTFNGLASKNMGWLRLVGSLKL